MAAVEVSPYELPRALSHIPYYFLFVYRLSVIIADLLAPWFAARLSLAVSHQEMSDVSDIIYSTPGSGE